MMMIKYRWTFVALMILLLFVVSNVSAIGEVFHVQHKFAGQELSLNALKEHDRRRHARILAGVDFPLGGDGQPTGTGLYYTKIGIGSPWKDYHVHVDTGSDIFWVNCIECDQCPKKSSIGVQLSLYDPKSSGTSASITCDEDFCKLISGGPVPGCTSKYPCGYYLEYGDGSSTTGYLVRDVIQYDRVSGNLLTTSANTSAIFGCAVQQSGNLVESSGALDGILGFGQSKTSFISQVASSGNMKKMFAHCLDGMNGGGIFAMGNVVQPKVKTTPLLPNKPHYNVKMKAIKVGKDTLPVPTTSGKETIIDSGATLAYFPEEIYKPLIDKIMLNHADLEVRTVEHFSCFVYSGSLDDGFPIVTLQFENSLELKVYPHEYLFKFRGNKRCIGWQNSGSQSKGVQDVAVLGDLVLSNKFFLYDLVNQTIGWTEYNCSSTIGLQDEQNNTVYLVGAHNLGAHNPSPSPSPSASSQDVGGIIMLLLLSALFHKLIY